MDKYKMQEAFDSEGFCFSKEKKFKQIVIGALPAEEVTTIFLGRRRKEIYALLDQVITPHPARIEAPCSDVPRCGGCVFQSLDYPKQLEYKQAKIKRLFPEESVAEVIPSPKVFQYRAKMDFSFSQNRAGEKFLGLTQAKGSGRVMATKSCHLASLWMNQALSCAQEVFKNSSIAAYDRSGRGDLRSLILREGINTHEKMAILEVVAHENSQLKKADIAAFFAPLRELASGLSCYLRIVQMIPKVPTQIYERHLGGPLHIYEKIVVKGKEFSFKISPSAFFQPNPEAATVLFNLIVEIVEPLGVQTICDLFCGTGTIGLILSSLCKSCVGVELNPYAVFDAQENAKLNRVSNISFVQQDAAIFIKENKTFFDLVVVDPPRAGLGPKASLLLSDFKAPYILYVSCNPVTQADDIAILKEKGYRVRRLQPLDQFPHTNHIENIILLSL